MTLILGMSKQDGIYLGVDYRVTNARTGKVLDDAAVKHLEMVHPPLGSGPRSLLAYTGVATLPDGTRTGDWIRETLRGEVESFDESMGHLTLRLNRDYRRIRGPLIITILVIHGTRRFLGGIANMRIKSGPVPSAYLSHEFGYHMDELMEPFAFAHGGGVTRAIADGHLGKVGPQLQTWPNKSEDHMGLLASINRRVAARDKTVSSHCHVSFIPREGAVKSQVFREGAEPDFFEMPLILAGIDLSITAKRTNDIFDAMMAGRPMPKEESVEEINRQLRRRP